MADQQLNIKLNAIDNTKKAFSDLQNNLKQTNKESANLTASFFSVKNAILGFATGATVTNPKILSNGNNNFTNNDYARTFEPLKKGGISVVGLDNVAGIHGNFMINTPCQTNCGTATATLNNAAANWTWSTSGSTFSDVGNLGSITFDTASFGINTTVACKQDCPKPVKATTSPLLICPGNTFINIAAGQPLGESYLWSDGNNNSARSFFNSQFFAK
jgi:hypothetical protein